MIYYQVKKEYDNAPRYYERPNHKLKQNGILVANELYTKRERSKIMNGSWIFNEIEISKNRVYFFFGARFYE